MTSKQVNGCSACPRTKSCFFIILILTVCLCIISIRIHDVYSRRFGTTEFSQVPLMDDDPFTVYVNWSKGSWSSPYQINKIPDGTWNDWDDCVTPEEIQLKFKRCYEASERKNPACRAVHQNPDAYWRSQARPGTKQTHLEDFKRMDLATRCCAFNYPNVLQTNPRDPPFPWEKDVLCRTGQLDRLVDTAHASRSSLHLVGVKGRGQAPQVNDDVMLEVVVRTGTGDVQRLGGDSVRVWLVSPDLGASIVADVIDLKNGSYVAKSVLPWAGKVKVRATIAHTRHLFRTVAYIQRYFSSSHWFTALFQRGAYSEATPCSPYPALPAFPAEEVCDLTARNDGFPWYCGRPGKKELTCSDYVSARKIDYPSFLPLTEAEEQLIEITESKRPFLIPNDIELDVKPLPGPVELTRRLPTLPCNRRDLNETFSETDQFGYLYNHSWRPFACRLPRVDAGFLQQCLKDTQILYLGDSNTRLQMDLLTPQVNCKNKIARARSNWHAPLWCDNDSLNISVKYFPPMLPFYGSIGEHMKPEVLSSEVSKIDAVPARGKFIVHLHHFLHFMPFHLALVEQRLKAVRDAVKRLLARNPQVFVVYQSAFASYDRSPKNKHKLNVMLAEIQRTVMQGLGPRVMFVQALPIMVALENKSGHPKESDQFLALYMGHICGRK